ncbi:hypothetical protein RRG08_007325 [Elysia crispata]|uniref:E3 ubiquitin-protein ligase CHFR n=1 Tax=Elysia crispata TaxID=231223 RepID=A0AAE1AQM4_9GAST|nr:hypothetical protein RRG08_007325 [Elysia crispata]
MTETVPCLLRIGENVKKYRLLKLDRDQVTIGRSGEVTYAILSNMISRCHAVIDKQEDGSWNLTDKKSLNGIYVNGRQLTPFRPYTMQEGDLIQLGVATSPDAQAEFIFKFYSSLKVRIEKKNNKRLKTEFSSHKDTLSASEALESESETEIKRKIPKEKEDAGDCPSKILREQIEQAQKEQALKEAEYQARLAEMEKLLKEKEDKQMEVQQQLERERQEKECQAREVEELRQKEQAILQEMHDKQEELKKEREHLKQKMQEELEANLKDREQALKSQLSAQREALFNEKKQVEENLQKEMEKALEEKNKELEKELQEQKKKLEQVIEKKEMEQKILESQLNETKEESATAKMQALKARDDVLSNFVDLMEMELQCTICNELFIKATSLNCAHVFCKLCINQWMKVKKECPNCRAPITSQMQALALDSYIDRMVEQLNDDLKQRRKELLEIRKAEQEKLDGNRAGPSTSVPNTTAGPRSGTAVLQRTASTTTTTNSNSSTSTVRTSSRISQRRARTRGGRANPTVTTRVSTPVTAVTAAGPSASNLSSSVASSTVARLLPSVRLPTAISATTSSSARSTTAAPVVTVDLTGVPSSTIPVVGALAAGSSNANAGNSVPVVDLTGIPSSTVSVVGAFAAGSSSTANHGNSAPAVATVVEVTPNTSAIELSSDREQTEEEEEENSDLTDSDDPIRYRSRRYYSDEEFEEADEDDESVEGDPSAYYGGYGRCYKCGMRGHWANGCPN